MSGQQLRMTQEQTRSMRKHATIVSLFGFCVLGFFAWLVIPALSARKAASPPPSAVQAAPNSPQESKPQRPADQETDADREQLLERIPAPPAMVSENVLGTPD